jgi:hypothetical protein
MESADRAMILKIDRERFAAEALRRRLESQHAEIERTLSESTTSPAADSLLSPGSENIDRLRQLQQMKATVRVGAISGGKIAPAFAALLELTETEVARLNTAMEQTRAGIKAPVFDPAKVSMVNGFVVVTVPPSEEGPKLRQDLLDEFAATLGPLRYAAVTAMSGLDSLDREFDAFGASPRQITFSTNGQGSALVGGYRLSDGRRMAGGSEVSITIIRDPKQFPEKYRWLSPIAPYLKNLGPVTGALPLAPRPEKK